MFAPKLGDILVRDGIISVQDKKTIAQTAGQESAAFAKGVLALGLMDEEELANYIEEHTQFKKASQELIAQADPQVQSLMDSFIIKQLEVLPLKLDGNRLLVAMIDPLDQDTLRQVEFFSGKTAVPLITTPTVLGNSLKKLIKDYQPKVSHLEAFLQAYQPRRIPSQQETPLEIKPDAYAIPDMGEIHNELSGDQIENTDDISTNAEASTPTPMTEATSDQANIAGQDIDTANSEETVSDILTDAASTETEETQGVDDNTDPVISTDDDGISPAAEMAAAESDNQPSENPEAPLSEATPADTDVIASEPVEAATPDQEMEAITSDEAADAGNIEDISNELSSDDDQAIDGEAEKDAAPSLEPSIPNDLSPNEESFDESPLEPSTPDEGTAGVSSGSSSTFHQLNNRLNHATIQLSLAQTQNDLNTVLHDVLAACNFNHFILYRILSEEPVQLEEFIKIGDQFTAFAETVFKAPTSESSHATSQQNRWQGPWPTIWRNIAEVVDADALKLIQGSNPHHDCQIAKFQAKWGDISGGWMCLTAHAISPKQFLMFWDTLVIVLKKYIATSHNMSQHSPSE